LFPGTDVERRFKWAIYGDLWNISSGLAFNGMAADWEQVQ
jgi:hypothetical protein